MHDADGLRSSQYDDNVASVHKVGLFVAGIGWNSNGADVDSKLFLDIEVALLQ